MASIPLDCSFWIHSSDPARLLPDSRDRSDQVERPMSEYTSFHREAWPLMVRNDADRRLTGDDPNWWLALGGPIGRELYDCFQYGDDHIRDDMIVRARQIGGIHGSIIAGRLERWRNDLNRLHGV